MSDANNLDNNTNNLSVDENDFDTFQSTAVKEESDYIMLSDILSDEVKQPTEMPGEFDNFLYENDEASQEFQTHLNDVVNSQLADAVTAGDSHINGAVDTHQPAKTVGKKPAQKRATKRGKASKAAASKDSELESTDLGNTRKSTRGRKPRVIPDAVVTPDYEEEVLTKTTKRSAPRRSAVLANGSAHQPAVKKRRGRKPKKVSTEPEQTNVENNLDVDQDADDMCLSQIKAQLSSSSQENKPDIKPILSDFEFNINNVIAQTSSVVVESMDSDYKPLQLQDNLVQDNLNHEDMEIETFDNGVPKCEEVETFDNVVPKCEKLESFDNVVPKREELEITNTEVSDQPNPEGLLVEDTTKRPVRKKARRTTKYQFDSDEDPFANVEVSEDERPKRRKKGTKYYSDEEYIPGGESKLKSSEDEINDIDEFDSDYEGPNPFAGKKRRTRKRTDGLIQNRTPKKKPQIEPEVTTLPPAEGSDDFEQMLESSVIKSDPELIKSCIAPSTPNQAFENFLANRIPGNELLIKKVSSNEKPALEIPSISPKELPKMVEKSSQTNTKQTTSSYVQTSSPYAIKMVHNINFNEDQSEKACEFLRNILSTTTELGKLMTEKSEEFMQKKINTTHVKDTTKMDYCVKKAFLLFKLAKDNLTTMEETLEKQYEEFLHNNNLHSAIAVDTKIAPKPVVKDDSDCEIVDDPIPAKATITKSVKSNAAKTVFLNKELSIKIAKKAPPTPIPARSSNASPNTPNKSGKNLNIQGKNAVWLNSAVMVKKVKPTNHFLAQDGRNKKPPDFVTEKMVKDFFDQYFESKASEICSQFTSPQWLHIYPSEVTCNYFVVAAADNVSSTSTIMQPLEPFISEPEHTNGDISTTNSIDNNFLKAGLMPKSLVSLCTKACNKLFKLRTNGLTMNHKDVISLSNLCLSKLTTKVKEEKAVLMSNLEDSVNNLIEDPDVTDDELDLEEPNIDESSIDGIVEIPSLKTLCFNVVSQYFKAPTMEIPSMVTIAGTFDWDLPGEPLDVDSCIITDLQRTPSCLSLDQEVEIYNYNAKSLQSIVYQYLLHVIYGFSTPPIEKNLIVERLKGSVVKIFKVKTLFKICFQLVSRYYVNPKPKISDIPPFNGLTIDTINTMSDEAFHGLGADDNYDNDNYTADDDYFNGDDYNDTEETPNEQAEENWMAKAKLKELRLGVISSIIGNTETEDALEPQPEEPFITRIKTEIPDEIPDDPIQIRNVKTEPEEHNEMVSIPDDIVTKAERQDYLENGQGNAACLTNIDADGFESFIRGNKMIQGVSTCLEGDDNIFSQSAYRVRRQHAPDSDEENDYDMDLLVPHDSEVFDMVKTKGNLMHSSSSDDEKSKSDKKSDKKKKGKTKKHPEPKQAKAIELPKKNLTKEKQKPIPEPVNEVAILTRRMREKIRNEEKKDESDSDSELNLNKSKTNKDKNDKLSKSDKTTSDNEIQCNSVDSTAVITDKKEKASTRKSARKRDADVEDSFTGFNSEDLTEIEKYKKQLDDVYDKILSEDMPDLVLQQPAVDEVSNASDRFSPPLMTDEPAEILECEPTMPIFEPKKPRKSKAKAAEIPDSSATESAVETGTEDNISLKLTPIKDKKKKALERPYEEKDGWKCYQIDINDSKLNQIPYIGLEKLPEAFVQTYFRYQEINCISKEDVEVDRLANLQSLHRSGKEPKPPKGRGKLERSASNPSGATTADVSPVGSDAEHFEELVPSDDESHLHNNEDLPLLPAKQTENVMAKSLLMDDKESASDGEGGRIRVKKEQADPDSQPLSKRKTKNVKVVDHPKNLVLTADKMMKKELDLLHAPVNLDEDLKYSPPDIKPKLKQSSKSHTKRERRKSRGDDSSSEEEKLWVNTKSKLLKRMEKRVQEDPCVDDAKRAKILSEYIDRRTDINLVRVGKKKRPSRMSRKKMLEREKQMRVLSKEFTEGPGLVGKGSSVSYSKGRKNIRKVLDKKSLARSTVTANMEEFARKKRLHMKQNRLRELLGYEEDVNVLVINDEVCLEYDFNSLQPVVTIHPFFTKVMKAHQYEGVKFMWDACFESLEVIASGHPGAGCILAHCMGLGKTLQVLALLHTVLTHPKVGMHRVLVCCPLSTVLNWVDEIHKWLGPVTNQIKVFELSKLKKTYERAYQLEDWYTGGGIFIVGYELFRSLTTLDPEYDDIRPTIVKKIRMALLDPGPDIVVCDEGHLLKNDSSVLALAMSRVKTKRRIVLTGTPMQNNLREYFCMVNFIKPNLLGTYSEYSNRFENPIMNGQHRDSREEDIRLMKARTHILHKVLEGCLQRQEASVLYPYLPTKHEYTVFIKLSEAQTDLYKHYLHNYANRLNNKNNILKDFHVLQKIWSHPHVLHSFLSRVRDDKVNKLKAERIEDDLAREELAATEDVKPIDAETGWWLEYLDNGKLLDELEASTKFQVVFNILKECVELDDKLLIFSTSLYTMDSLEYFLKKINNWSLGQEYYRLDGTVPPEVRHKWCREFNAENNHKTKLFLISTRAGSLGLNMTAANRVIILDTSWNPAHDIQSIFRIYRFGQKKDCFIYRLVAMGTMEQKIYERSVTKQAVACRVVDEQQIDRHYNMADLAELYDFSCTGWGIQCGVAGAVRDVVLLRVARLPCLHAAHEHDSLLRAARDQDLPEHERAAAWTQFQQEHEHTKVLTGMALALTSVFGPQQTAIPTDFGLPVPALTPRIDPNINPVTVKTEPIPPLNLLAPLPPKTQEKGKKGKKIKTQSLETPESMSNLNVNRIEISPNNTNFNGSAITIIPPKGMKDPGNVLDRIRQILKNTDFRNADGVIDAAQITKVISSLVSSEQITIAPPKSNVQPTIIEPPIATITAQPIAEVSKVGRGRGRPRKDVVEQTQLTKKPPENNDLGGLDPPGKGKRGRPRKDAAKAVEQSQLTSKAPENNDLSDLDPHISRDGRYKRKAAVVAERNLESRDLTVSSDDDFDNDVSRDYQPDDNDASQDSDFIAPVKALDKPTEASNKNRDDSILLSDDDDIVNTDSTPPDKSTVIPMHRSLLKNKNFIKIVAHTYLKGNPMLDEDAAMLAAEYSTNKALKEVEITGKDIDSGPIFDIAMQVLGVDVLKKLIDKDSNKTATADTGMKIAFQKLPIKEEPTDGKTYKAKPTATKTKPTTKPTETPKIRIKTETEMRLPAPAAAPAPVIQNQPSRRKAQYQTRQMFEDDDIGADMDGGLLLRMTNQPPQAMNNVPEMNKYKPGPSSVKAAKARRSMAGPYMAGPSIAGSSMTPGSMQAVFEESIVQSAIQKFVPSDTGHNNIAGVVPIGMFKGNENLGLNMPVEDECILPDDDDDLRLGQIRPPNLALPPNITPVILRANPSQPTLELSPMMRRHTQNEQNLANASDLGPTINDGNRTLQLKRVTSLPEILSAKKQKLAAATAQQQTSVAANSATISLDSDDEESVPPSAQINAPQTQFVRTTNAKGNQCIVIPAFAFQEILKRAQSTTPVSTPNNLNTQQTIYMTSTAQVKTGDKLFIPSAKQVGPASNIIGPASKTVGPASTTVGPASTTVGPASKTVGPASKTVGPASKTVGPASQPKAAKAVAAAKIAIPAKPPSAKPKPPVRPKTPPKPVEYPDIAISSSSDSDRSRSPSPTDPMAILRNVVHIQANPAPAPPKPLCTIKPAAKGNPFAGVPAKQNTSTQSKATPHSKTTRSNQPTKPNPPVPPNTSVKPQPKLKIADNVKIKTSPYDARIPAQGAKNVQASKTAPNKPNTQPSKSTPQSKTAKNSKDDSNYRLLGSFDLTDLPDLSVSKTSADKPGPSSAAKQRSKEPVKPTTVSGKSRDIILTPGNKSGVKAATKEPSILEKANSVKRKPEPPPVAPPPKKKKPTRLEEFSLDDLEDIIELE